MDARARFALDLAVGNLANPGANPFGGEQEDPPKAWICLMKKRSV